MRPVGANPGPRVRGLDELPGKSNYFIGNDPSRWRTNIVNYAKVLYKAIYRGVDLVYYGNQRQLEWDFVVAPGADANVIKLSLEEAGPPQRLFGGSRRLRGVPLKIDSQGDLLVRTSAGEVRFHKPVAYQLTTDPETDASQRSKAESQKVGVKDGTAIGGDDRQRATQGEARTFIDCRYVLKSNGQVAFRLAAYDPRRLLVIDPVLSYSTYLGGSGADAAYGIAVDTAGSAYVTGSTDSPNFPTAAPFQGANGGGTDAFVTKLNSTGTGLVYSTYLGGIGFDRGAAIAVDSAGSAYVTGFTFSTDFPLQGAFQTTNHGGGDAFVTKINPDGSLGYSSYLGGNGLDVGQSIALDSSRNAYVTGSTESPDFPTVNPFQLHCGGFSPGPPPSCPASDAFVAEVNAAGSVLIYSTYLGGSAADGGEGIAVDSSRNAYVTGFTFSTDFPLQGAFQTTNHGGADAFVTKLNPAGSALAYSSYLGGSGADTGQAIAVASDASGSAYVAGSTASTDFAATTRAFQPAYGGSGDAFVAKIDPANVEGVALAPQQLTFGNQIVGTTSTKQTVTLSNVGSGPLTINSIAVSPDFALDSPSTTCPRSGGVPGGTNCAIGVVFSPRSTGTLTGAVTITDSASGSPHQVALTGTGTSSAPAVTLSPTSLTFDALLVGSTSPFKSVTLTNSGSAVLNVTSITPSATDSGDFHQNNSCGATPTTLDPSKSCIISVTFTPTATGNRTGSVTITDDASGSPQTIALTGTGNAAFVLSSASTSSTINIDATSATFTVMAGNAPGAGNFTGTINLACTGGATCSFSPSSSITTGQSSTLTVTGLSPSTANPFNFSATGTSGSQTATLSLSVKFADFSLSPSPPLRTIVAGDSTTYTLNVRPSNGFSQAVSLSCGGVPTAASCSVSPASVTLDGTSTLTATVTVTTTKRSMIAPVGRSPRPPGGIYLPIGLLALGMLTRLTASRKNPLGTSSTRSLRPASLVLAVIALLVLLGSACGSSNRGPVGTPAGNYPLTITGTFGSVARSTSVNLSVG